MRTLSRVIVLCVLCLCVSTCVIHAQSQRRQSSQQGGRPPTQMKFEDVQEPCPGDCGIGVCTFRYNSKSIECTHFAAHFLLHTSKSLFGNEKQLAKYLWTEGLQPWTGPSMHLNGLSRSTKNFIQCFEHAEHCFAVIHRRQVKIVKTGLCKCPEGSIGGGFATCLDSQVRAPLVHISANNSNLMPQSFFPRTVSFFVDGAEHSHSLQTTECMRLRDGAEVRARAPSSPQHPPCRNSRT